MVDSFKVFNGHRIGSSHIAKGNPCEDFSMSYQNDFVSIAVISDGHGDKNCFRSTKGAQIACEVAIERIKNTFTCNEAVDILKDIHMDYFILNAGAYKVKRYVTNLGVDNLSKQSLCGHPYHLSIFIANFVKNTL